jgi:hypothetical protein
MLVAAGLALATIPVGHELSALAELASLFVVLVGCLVLDWLAAERMAARPA